VRAAERISAFARVDLELAELVVRGAQVHHVAVDELRGEQKNEKSTRVRRWVAARARPRWSWWEIGRALNRDHSTMIHHHRRAKPANDCPLGHHRRRSANGAAADKVIPS
jgi:chromosomal replication initiation ATPase DnaA